MKEFAQGDETENKNKRSPSIALPLESMDNAAMQKHACCSAVSNTGRKTLASAAVRGKRLKS